MSEKPYSHDAEIWAKKSYFTRIQGLIRNIIKLREGILLIILVCLLFFIAGALGGWWFLNKIVPVFIVNQVHKDMREVDFAFHTLNTFCLRTFLYDIEPRIYPYLNEKMLSKIHRRLRSDHSIVIEAAIRGMSSDAQMAEYLLKTGLLKEMSITPEEARKQLSFIDDTANKFQPKSACTHYYPTLPPDPPIRIQAEFESIGAVVLSFPVYYPPGWKIHAEFIRQITSQAAAFVIVPNLYWQKAVMLYLSWRNIITSPLKFFHFLTDDVWTRDYGPTGVLFGKEQRPAFIWNPYYIRAQNYYKFDAEATAALSMSLDIPAYRLPMVIDGGNILTDGKGTMIMFESVLDVNPDIDRPKLEKIVRDYFGCTRLITFPACRGDITGHIDMAAKFINEDTLMVSRAAKAFKWHEDFEKIAEHLGQCKSVNGKDYTIVRVPMPQTKRASKNVWTYINSLTLNKKVIVPTFGVPEDDQALEIYRSSMPDYEIVGIDFHHYPVGSVHCQSKEIHQTLFNG